MTLNDPDVISMVNKLLDSQGVAPNVRGRYVREHRTTSSVLLAIKPVVDRYLAIMEPFATCQIEHDHWEGKMICGSQLPCRTHGGGR